MRTLTEISVPEASHKDHDRDEWSLIVQQMLGRYHLLTEEEKDVCLRPRLQCFG